MDTIFGKFIERTIPSLKNAIIKILIGGKESEMNLEDFKTLMASKPIFMVNGVFVNMFGGDPGTATMDVLEWGASASPAATHSSVLCIPINCKIIAVGFKWINASALNLPVGGSYELRVLKMDNPDIDSTTVGANFTFVGNLNISLDETDNGTRPGKFSTDLNINFQAGDVIRIEGVETGTAILASTDESELTVVFQLT